MSQLFRYRGWCFGIRGVVLVSLGLSIKIHEFIKIPNMLFSHFCAPISYNMSFETLAHNSRKVRYSE
jgi:hypothetical protein